MPEKVYHVKGTKKRNNILEKYVVEKYGSMNNFLNKFEEINHAGYKREKIENTIIKSDFLKKMQVGMKVCDGLRIDRWELFGNENICVLDSVKTSGAEVSPEENFSLLNFDARQKTIEYISNLLEN